MATMTVSLGPRLARPSRALAIGIHAKARAFTRTRHARARCTGALLGYPRVSERAPIPLRLGRARAARRTRTSHTGTVLRALPSRSGANADQRQQREGRAAKELPPGAAALANRCGPTQERPRNTHPAGGSRPLRGGARGSPGGYLGVLGAARSIRRRARGAAASGERPRCSRERAARWHSAWRCARPTPRN